MNAVAEVYTPFYAKERTSDPDMETRKEQLASLLYGSHLCRTATNLLPEPFLNLGIYSGYTVQDMVTIRKMANNSEKITGYYLDLARYTNGGYVKHGEPVYGTLTNANTLKKVQKDKDLTSSYVEASMVFTVEESLESTMGDREIAERVLISAGIVLRRSSFGIPHWHLPADLLAADNSGVLLVTAGKPIRISVYDIEELGEVRFSLGKKGAPTAMESTCEVHGNPIDWLKWLSGKLELRNLSIEKGMVLSTGPFTKPLLLEKGTWKAKCDIAGYVEMEVP